MEHKQTNRSGPRIVDLQEYRPEEVNLMDLLLLPIRQGVIFWGLLAASTIGGIVAAYTIPVRYLYTTTVEIGLENGLPLESTNAVIAKVKDGYIPVVTSEWQRKEPDWVKPDIAIHSPKHSNLLVLEITASEEESKKAVAFGQVVVEMVLSDHNRAFSVMQKEYAAMVSQTESALRGLRENTVFIAAQIKRVDTNTRVLESQLADIKRKLVGTTGSSPLMNERYQMRAAELEERLYIDLPKQKSDLGIAITRNNLDQVELSDNLEKFRTKLAKSRGTRQIVPLTRKQEAGLDRGTTIFLAVFLGVVLALVASLIAERVRGAISDRRAPSKR